MASAPTSIASWWLDSGFPASRLLEFALGAWLATEILSGTSWNIGLLRASALAGAAYVLASLVNSRVTLVPFLLLIAAAAATDVAGRQSLFARRWLVWCGEISFCFYLVHLLIVRLIAQPIDSPAAWMPVAELALSVTAAAALHYAVERPCERRIRIGKHRSTRTSPELAEQKAPG